MNNRFYILLIVTLIFCNPITSQIINQPISWSSKVNKIDNSIYEIEIKGVIDENNKEWHVYGLGPYNNGPTPTSLVLEWDSHLSSLIRLEGDVYLKTKSHIKYDDLFFMEIGICKDSVVIARRVRVLSDKPTNILAIVEWQACDNGSCLPPTEKEFEIKLPGLVSTSNGALPNDVTTPATNSTVTKALSSSSTTKSSVSSASISYESFSELTPESPSSVSTSSESPSESPSELSSELTSDATSELTQDITPESSTIILPNTSNPLDSSSIWAVIIEAILWGFVALLTPCVFPMVPMTVSFFLKQSQDSGRSRGRIMASLFGFSIILLYTLPIAAIIIITYFAGGEAVTADIFNWLATHWLPNILFFVIFMVFAASFFGAFEIVLPSWMVNKSDSRSDQGGYLGVFFMALTLVLVSFSCTGPIVGTILIKSTQGDIWEPIFTMLAFSTAFALPFTVFAFAPSLLKDLPKSGGWLNSVKVVLGFIEVALGFKFLSVADQVYHWGLLDREVYLAIWIVVFSLLGFYLLGKLRFAHDSPQGHITVKRLSLSIVTFSFVVYMLPGMWGAPLKALSGYLPPMNSQDFRISSSTSLLSNTSANSPYKDIVSDSSSNSLSSQGIVPLYSDFLHLPHGLEGFFRYQEGLAYAQKVGKPLFVDFTGHGCVNCREMEARVWSDPQVQQLLRDHFVIVALYADDKKTAIESDWITTERGRVLKSIGKINSHLAMTKFSVNAQPYYAIIDPITQEHLVPSRGYNLDVLSFITFLQSAL